MRFPRLCASSAFSRLMFLVVLAVAVPLFAQPRVSAVYSPLAADFQINPNGTPADPPMYAPALYPSSNGSLGMITMGSCLGQCPSDGAAGDALWRWRRAAGGSWSGAYGGLSPSKNIQTTSLGETIPAGALRPFTEVIANFNYNAACQYAFNDAKGAFGNPSIVKIGSKLFMAYEKGNGDWWTGEMWFAVSSDEGATWSVYPTPIFYPLYHRWHHASAPSGSSEFCNEGFVGPSLTTVDVGGVTYFHLYAGYAHPASEYGPGGYSIVDYRWPYNPGHPYGFAGPVQLYYNGAYQTHSGKLVWTYDSGAVYTPSDTKLDPTKVQSSWGSSFNVWAAGSVATQVISGQTYKLMIVDGWRNAGDPLRIVTSCDGTNWSAPISVSTSLVSSYYPGKIIVNNAIWHGTLGGVTSLWGFLSLGDYSKPGAYSGTRILPVKLDGVVPTCG